MREKIKNSIAKALGVELEDLAEEGLLRQELGIAGIELADLVETIKTEFKAEIPEEELTQAQTLGQFLDLVEQYAQDEL